MEDALEKSQLYNLTDEETEVWIDGVIFPRTSEVA